jgi:hypothetical protein
VSDQFRTFQTPQRYEDALGRHGQWLRWTAGITCPCLNTSSMQPDPHCTVCKGRGRIYKSPGKFRLMDEIAHHDSAGKVYPKYPPVISGSVTVYRKGVLIALAGTQPADRSYVQLDPPYPKAWQVLTMDYEYDPDIAVTDEDSEVYDETGFILRTTTNRFSERGKSFEGSIKSVSRVYNVDKTETYTVTSAFKEYIYLVSMGTWVSGDVLQVDYVYQAPFYFLLTGISPRMRYQQPYVLDEADAVLVTPYWAQVAPDDLLTAMAVEQIGRAVVNPTISGAGNDEIRSYYDLSRLLRVIDRAGTEYTTGPGKNVEIFERNELKWNVTKPAQSYVAQFTYHPTYTALTNMQTLRNSENKAFVNRVGVKQFDRVHDRIEY